jgi:hypothetical protein
MKNEFQTIIAIQMEIHTGEAQQNSEFTMGFHMDYKEGTKMTLQRHYKHPETTLR